MQGVRRIRGGGTPRTPKDRDAQDVSRGEPVSRWRRRYTLLWGAGDVSRKVRGLRTGSGYRAPQARGSPCPWC